MISASAFRFIGIVALGVVSGGLLGTYGQCTSGTCPLTSTWWRGALYGGSIAILIACASRRSG